MICSQNPLTLSGFWEGIDGRWIVTTATHRLSGQGYLTKIEAAPETAPATVGAPTITT